MPNGGTEGTEFEEVFGCEGVRISGFEISHGPYVHGLKVFYEINGTLTPGSMYGGYTGNIGNASVTLDSDERIVSISGRSGDFIDQLEFVTNEGRQLGPYGGPTAGAFTVGNPSCEPRGIFGRQFLSVDDGPVISQIGFYCA